jgi:glycosyltransferase involved in cell wall biosynthesis
MKVPVVSILVVTYNHENYIEQTLKSIINQRLTYNFEIVVGNDASYDSSKSRIEEVRHQYNGLIKVVNHKMNIGFIQNYLSVLKYCRGKYIAFCEGDDYWIDETKLQKQVDYLEKNPDCGLVYTDYNTLNENGGFEERCVLNSGRSGLDGVVIDKMLKGDNQVMTLTVCLRRNLLGEDYVQFMNDDAILTADFPTWMWCAFQASFHFIPDVTAVYRRHDKQITNGRDNLFVWKFMRSHLYIRKKFMSVKHYIPVSWKQMDILVNKEILFHSFKLNLKREYGIAAYKILTIHYRHFSIKDTLFYLSVRYKSVKKITEVIRIVRVKFFKSHKHIS